jgi:hypothetical protein
MSAGRDSGPALALLAVALILGGCGAQDKAGPDPDAAEGVGLVRAGSTAQFANCRDWRRGTDAQRYATIADIRGQLTPQSSPTAESDLSDQSAYGIFQSSCATDGADHLRLYKIYARAQAFAPLRTDADREGPTGSR